MTKRFIIFVLTFLCFSCSLFDSRPRDKTLIALMNFDVVSFDPIESNDNVASTVLCEIYEGLLKFDENLKPVLALAESMEVKRGIEYTFKIKKDVHFHDGSLLTAKDVKFSLERAIASDVVGYLFTSIVPNSIKIIDDYTIRFSLKMPNEGILMTLCHTASFIVSEKVGKLKISGKNALALEPVGTGPFKFIYAGEGVVELERFEGYYGKAPYFQFMQFKTDTRIPERIIDVETGKADVVCNVTLPEIKKCYQSDVLRLYSVQGFGVEYLGMNMRHAPLDDVRVRRAISKGIDVDLINKVTSNGLYESATAPYAPGLPYSITDRRKVIKRDVEEAKRLLFQAGYTDVINLRMVLAESFERSEMVSKIKEQLSRIGVNLEMEVLEWNTFLSTIQSGDADLFLLGWIPDTLDPDSALRPCFYSNTDAVNSNYVGCSDETLDALLDEGLATLDEGKRKEIYEAAQERIMELMPAIFLYVDKLALAMPRHYEGIIMNPLGYHFLAYMKPILTFSE
ncbi:MAG: ABC transporter substrate-binding protein [Treponema sp.]